MLAATFRLPPNRVAFSVISIVSLVSTTVLFLRLYLYSTYSTIDTDDTVFVSGCQDPVVAANAHPRENAVLIMLAKNSELPGILSSIKSIEGRFNRFFHYPYVFLNDKPFNSTVMTAIRNATSSMVEFGQVPEEMWNFPAHLNQSQVAEAIALQGDRAIMYGELQSYHKMCRFYSGFFYKHGLLAKYDWYWRLDPDVTFYCDITYDPFVYMAKHKKVYGFTIFIEEFKEAIPNLFRYISYYKRQNNIQSKGLWELFVLNDPDDPEAMEGESYNLCHFWSNFEIARLDFFRSPQYGGLFDTLEKSGGFWTERVLLVFGRVANQTKFGDAPIHSLAAGLFLAPSQVHYFRDFGYRHSDIHHCPANAPGKQLSLLSVNNLSRESWDNPRKGGIGCRCQCPRRFQEIEGASGSCHYKWLELESGYGK